MLKTFQKEIFRKQTYGRNFSKVWLPLEISLNKIITKGAVIKVTFSQ